MGAALGEAKAQTAQQSGIEKGLAGMGANMVRQTRPVRDQAIKQLLEAMRTGGVKAKIPLIQQAVSRANQATSGALTQTAEQLGSRNIGGAFASRIMAATRLAGNQQAAAVPTQVAESLIGQYMPFVGQIQSLGMGAYSTAAQSAQQLSEFNAAQRQQSILQGGIFGGGRIAGIL